jgi:sulfatase maturation enzyme AslB (radical SAM superfamily)
MLDLKLKLRNSGKYIKVDKQDWNLVKDIHWVLRDNKVVTRNGRTYEDVIGLKGHKNKMGSVFDKTRDNYIPNNKDWVFSKYHNQYILVDI